MTTALPGRTPRHRCRLEAEYIVDMAPMLSQRTGQFLFNELKHEIADIVRGTNLDTFYRNMTFDEVAQWLEEHVVIDNDGNMTCLFSGDVILWKDPNG